MQPTQPKATASGSTIHIGVSTGKLIRGTFIDEQPLGANHLNVSLVVDAWTNGVPGDLIPEADWHPIEAHKTFVLLSSTRSDEGENVVRFHPTANETTAVRVTEAT